MSDNDGFEIGQLTAEVANLKDAVEKLWECVSNLQNDIKKLEKLVSRGRGFFAGMMVTASMIGGGLTFIFIKGAKFFGLH